MITQPQLASQFVCRDLSKPELAKKVIPVNQSPNQERDEQSDSHPCHNLARTPQKMWQRDPIGI